MRTRYSKTYKDMARPVKQGLDYWPCDVDIFDDEKVVAISGEFGIKGEIVIFRLLCAIYRQGYFIRWSEMLQMKLLHVMPGISKELLSCIVERLVKWQFFDERLFNTAGILTSKAIQRTFFGATTRRKGLDIDESYLLIEEESGFCKQYASNNSVNVSNNTQSKVNSKDIEKEISTNVDTKKKDGLSEDNPAPPIEIGVSQTLSRKDLKDTLQKRTEEFYQSLVPYLGEFSKEMLRNFYNHWSEPNKSKTKMRWEMERTWDLHRRLLKWQSNDDKWSKGSQQKRGMTILEAVSSVQPVPQMALETIDVKQLMGGD